MGGESCTVLRLRLMRKLAMYHIKTGKLKVSIHLAVSRLGIETPDLNLDSKTQSHSLLTPVPACNF